MAPSITSANGMDVLRGLTLQCQAQCHLEGMLFSRLQDIKLTEGMLQVSRPESGGCMLTTGGRPELNLPLSGASVIGKNLDVMVRSQCAQSLKLSFSRTEEARTWTDALQTAIAVWDSIHKQVAAPSEQLAELLALKAQLTLLRQKSVENERRCQSNVNDLKNEREQRILQLESEAQIQKTQCASLKSELELLRHELASAAQEKSELEQELQQEKQKQFAFEAAQSHEKQDLTATLQQEIAALNKEKGPQDASLKALEQEMAKLRNEKAEKDAALDALQQEIWALTSDNAQNDILVHALNQEIAALKMEKCQNASYDTLEGEIAALEQDQEEGLKDASSLEVLQQDMARLMEEKVEKDACHDAQAASNSPISPEARPNVWSRIWSFKSDKGLNDSSVAELKQEVVALRRDSLRKGASQAVLQKEIAALKNQDRVAKEKAEQLAKWKAEQLAKEKEEHESEEQLDKLLFY